MDAKKRVLCPSCFGLWEPQPSPAAGALLAAPLAAPRWARERGRRGPAARLRAQLSRLLGRAPVLGGLGGHTLTCPNLECGANLPPGAAETDTIVIGLVGGLSTGKTMYLTALLNALVQKAELSGNGCHFAPLGDSANRYLEAEQTLFVKRQPIELTPGAESKFGRPPLAIRMTVTHDEETKAYNLLLFDASGEQLQRSESLNTHCRYVKYADGLIFMVDPVKLDNVTKAVAPELLGIARPATRPPGRTNGSNGGHTSAGHGSAMLASLPQIAEQLAPTSIVALPKADSEGTPATGGGLFDAPITVPAPVIGEAAASPAHAIPVIAPAAGLHIPAHFILSSVAQAIRDAQGLAPGAVVPTKAAIVISKADVLRYMPGVKDLIGQLGWPGTSSLHYNHVQTIREALTVTEILDQIAGPMMGTASAREFERPSFHVTSATGVPLKSNGEFGMVRPFRVSDPLGSILFRLEVIR